MGPREPLAGAVVDTDLEPQALRARLRGLQAPVVGRAVQLLRLRGKLGREVRGELARLLFAVLGQHRVRVNACLGRRGGLVQNPVGSEAVLQ